MNFPKIPVSNGELIDKITILSIKIKFSSSPYIKLELDELISIAKKLNIYKEEYLQPLLDVNSSLWDVEDRLRKLENKNKFDKEFIELARNVYKLNDKRAEVKRKINEETNSLFFEIKVY